jgi:hypothetical protein
VKKTLLNPFRLLNSVPFGILLMALTAAFIAAGSARPWFREMGVDEWPFLRNWFDKTDMQFFNAWPLKTLMVLLVANLIVVTWRRIPLTPPRYGVWCIHAGIITLICGTSLYYARKVEGRIMIFKDPRVGPTVVDHFYDKDQRSLYVRYTRGMEQEQMEIPLPTLPRFKEYDDKSGSGDALASRGLTGMDPASEVVDPDTGNTHQESLGKSMGYSGAMTMDVIGFYPYANVNTDFVTDPGSNQTGIEVVRLRVADQQPVDEFTLVGSDPQHNSEVERAPMDLRHLEATPEMVEALTRAVGELFHLDVTVGDQKPIPLDVQVGKTYALGATGYSVTIQSFDPSFPTFETGEPVPLMMMLVTSPTQTFRRSLIAGRAEQTDFKLNGVKREQHLIDRALKIDFKVNDPFHLLDLQHSVRHTFLTPAGKNELIDLVTGVGTVTSQVLHSNDGALDIDIKPDSGSDAPFAPFANGAGAATSEPTTAPAAVEKLHIERRDHLKAVDSINIKPTGQRDRDAEDDGRFQVAKLRFRMGDWSQIVYAPFATEAGDRFTPDQWRGGYVHPPGGREPFQVQLGYTRRPLPARLSLDRFNLVPYPGAPADAPGTMYKDFVSTVTLTDNKTGESYTDVAKMNHPIYYNGGDWLFFQATFDSSQDHLWTGLGIGNRPARGIMWAGFIMIVVGLFYAFYLKPVIVRAMKEKAIAQAIAAGKTVRIPKDLVVN